MKKFASTLRWQEWGGHKQGILAAAVYLQAMGAPSGTFWCGLAAFVGGLAGLCWSYLLNAVADADEDRSVGKLKEFATLARRDRWLAFVALAAVGVLAGVGAGNPWAVSAISGVFVSGWLYSVGPRLRDRPVLGVVICVVGQRTLPLVAVLATGHLPILVQVALHVTFAGSGLRGILVHHFVDRDADRLSGHSTLGGSMGEERLRRLLVRTSGCELAGVVLAAVWSWPLGVALATWALANVGLLHLWRRWTWAQRVLDYAFMPLNHLYFCFLPVTLAVVTAGDGVLRYGAGDLDLGTAVAQGAVAVVEVVARRDILLGVVSMTKEVAR